MNAAQGLREEWDRLIEDMSVEMTKVVVGPQAHSELLADPDKDHSVRRDSEGNWFFRNLPVDRQIDYDGYRIETRSCRG